ncbi:hypothetical protein Hdeb2414_s0010g00338491 [Helianthus debilis subsp. tardiflorus]
MNDKHHHKTNKNKHTQNHPNCNHSFKPSLQVKGLRFGGQIIVKSFTIRRTKPTELHHLLSLPPSPEFLSTAAFIPTNFTILAHHAWHTHPRTRY